MTDMTIEELKSLEYTAAKTVGNTAQRFGQWAGGDEITANRMNHIDTGIYDAINGVRTLANTIDNNVETATVAETKAFLNIS